jgi:hypothetical protein
MCAVRIGQGALSVFFFGRNLTLLIPFFLAGFVWFWLVPAGSRRIGHTSVQDPRDDVALSSCVVFFVIIPEQCSCSFRALTIAAEHDRNGSG